MSEDRFDTLDHASTDDGRGQEGKLLAGRYRIVRKLGEGGMGMVYLAEDLELAGHKVAIKFIPPALAGNARVIKNLKREALTAMQLTHRNIVRLHDLHTDGHQKFLVMEYIEGKTLDDLLAEKEGERLSLQELLPIAEQVAAALDYAHSQNVLHRDLKPSNIMIAAEGAAKLLDFGIAREMKDSFTRVTGQETSGTLPYMSPEQLMGDRPSVAMDIYSFAAVLYECLSGHPPFHAGDIREQIKSKSPDPIASLAAHTNETLLSALAKDPTQRPRSVGQLVTLLKRMQPRVCSQPTQERSRVDHSTPVVAHETEVVPRQGPVQKHKPPAVGCVIACAVGLIGLIVLISIVVTLVGRNPGDRNPAQSVPPSASPKSPQVTTYPTGVSSRAAPVMGQQASPTSASLPPDLIEVSSAQYASLEGLASGSGEAQERQRQAVAQLRLPLEVQTVKTGIMFRLIPGGSFTMGSPSGEVDRSNDEMQHEVTLSKAFYCGKHEVTQGQWERVMGSNPLSFKGAGPDAPVERVSWEDCQGFVKRLCQMEGVGEGTYRLLTEGEWEYACRAGSTSKFYFGDDGSALHEYMWYGGNSGGSTHPVGQKKPNAWGLYDMHGNVLEWCEDSYWAYSSDSVTNPTGPASGVGRVVRGGSCDFDAGLCRSAFRCWSEPDDRDNNMGIRLARTTPSYP